MSVHDNDGDVFASLTHALTELGEVDSHHEESPESNEALREFFGHGGGEDAFGLPSEHSQASR
jgi:hypothetical protein